ncbi:MAG: GNAT family N-acetyltransferase [Chloroflexi bacterium]|nr:GNAT family N-acetyltransferase [Chloroflexota bacterium]MDA1145171.1 GNAT family N-acetyltransferase [Chloroflexota bacterium]
MTAFTFRKTEDPDDVAAFLALFEPNGEPSIHPRLVVDEGEWDLWLAESEGELAGGALLRVQPDHTGAFRGFEDNLLIDGRFRRQGLARQLMAVTEAHYRERGLVGMQAGGTADDVPAIGLFESLGYHTVRRYTRPERMTAYGVQPSLPRVTMWKDF